MAHLTPSARLFSSPSHLPSLTYKGTLHHLFIFHLISPRVTRDSPLEVITSSLKQQECLSKLTVGRCSLSCRHIVVWVGLFPTYNLCDNTTFMPLDHSLDIWMLVISCVIFFLEHPSDNVSWCYTVGMSLGGVVLHGPLMLDVRWGPYLMTRWG
jgi:hypothetical protein